MEQWQMWSLRRIVDPEVTSSNLSVSALCPDGEVANTAVCKTVTRRFESCSRLDLFGSVAQWQSSGLLTRVSEVRSFLFPLFNFYISLHPQNRRQYS